MEGLDGTTFHERSIECRSRALEYKQRGSENITNRVGGTRTPLLQLAYKRPSVLYPHLSSRLSAVETFRFEKVSYHLVQPGVSRSFIWNFRAAVGVMLELRVCRLVVYFSSFQV